MDGRPYSPVQQQQLGEDVGGLQVLTDTGAERTLPASTNDTTGGEGGLGALSTHLRNISSWSQGGPSVCLSACAELSCHVWQAACGHVQETCVFLLWDDVDMMI